MESDESRLIAYCGLHCGDCPFARGEIADAARDLLRKLDAADFDRIARGLAELVGECRALACFPDCRANLEVLADLRCAAPCREGGGSEGCGIRLCCRSRGLDGCWCCDLVETCETLDWIAPVNGDRHRRNLRVLRERGVEAFLRGERLW